MADSPSSPAAGDVTGAGPDRGPSAVYPGTPRWVKVFGIVVLILVLLGAGITVAGGGQHGPGRHMPSGAPGGPGGHIPPVARGQQQP
jgi:hypothetical protein